MQFSICKTAELFRIFNLLTALVAGTIVIQASTVSAEEGKKYHGLSLIDKPKYPPDFKHFNYVNPNAPKGGSVRIAAIGSFDSFNPIMFKGVAATGLGLIYESLMYDSIEEPSTSYGLIAEWVSYPDDFSSVTFKLRDEARWHDGRKISVDDVIFSLNMIKKANPRWAYYYKNITKVEKTGEREVTFSFDVKGNRELPMITGQLLVLPKHYWTAKGSDGEVRDLMKTTLEPPLGSGPYKIASSKNGRSVTYQRVKDFWGADLPVNVGHYNFDKIRFEYFRDTTVAFEAFKAGQLDFHQESSSKNWATGYDINSVTSGLIKRQKVTLKTGQPMQAFVMNTRKSKFADRNVRQAFNYAYDFEWANKNLFYGQYARVSSYFQNTELASSGLPKGKELEILNEVKDQIPSDVFTTEYRNPVNKKPRDFRTNLRKATKLLKGAGWSLKNRILTNTKTGEEMKVEFLLISPAFERVVQPFVKNLEKLGIQSNIRVVDSAQYKRRLDNFDFDIVVGNFAQSHSPGNEQRSFWGSKAADEPGSRNLIGIKDPGIDKLVDKVIFAEDRAELVAATRALDRVLLANHYVVPQWFAPYERIAYWDRFGQPKTLPAMGVGFLSVWWYDKSASVKLNAIR